MSNSSERIAVVIGGASGIGWATARALAADGCRVTVADRNADGARGRAAELGDPHTAAEVDVTDESSVQRLFEQIGPLDVVVNCAGFGSLGLITDLLGRRVPLRRRRVPERVVHRRQVRGPEAARRWLPGVDQLAQRAAGGRRDERLLLGQGRPFDADPGRGAGNGAAGNPRQRGRRRASSTPHSPKGPTSSPASSRTTWRTLRWAAQESPRRSRTRWSSCARRSRPG